jgi:hypothetical protein
MNAFSSHVGVTEESVRNNQHALQFIKLVEYISVRTGKEGMLARIDFAKDTLA